MTQLSVTPPYGVYWEPFRLRLSDGGAKYLYYSAADVLHFRDLVASMEFGNELAFTDDDKYGLVLRRINADYKLIVWVNASTLNIAKFDDGVFSELQTWPLTTPLVADANYWLNVHADGADFDISVWGTDPALGGVADTTALYALVSGDQGLFNIDTVYWAGFYVESANWDGAWIDNFSYSPIRLSGASAATLVNAGNGDAQPIFELYGTMVNPRITNTSTGEFIELAATIPEGEIWTIDLERRTVKDENGVNRFAALTIPSGWPELIEGPNTIALDVDSMSPAARIRVIYRDAWI